MALRQKMEIMLPVIEQELKNTIVCSIGETTPDLRGMLTYAMGWEGEGAGPDAQGKRIRPVMVLLCAQAAGADWERALPAAAAVELLHNFSLIHDDIQDQSPLRRNRPTVWVKWGVAQAINAGDVLFTLSLMAAQGLTRTSSADIALAASAILHRACLDLTRGQYLDLSYESSRMLEVEAYWPMVGGKTSALLGSCAKLGALVSGADAIRMQAFYDFGYQLGLAFQVLDDWLGIWGDAALTGKSNESDLASGKKTLPVLYALSRNGKFARRWMDGPILGNEANEVVRFLEEEGAEEFTLEKANELTRQALDALKRAVPDESHSAELRELTEYLLKRKK
jgi:geranylgeranyl diphosphate synthase, type I